ncbi:MAG: hypothetical protein A3J38_08680 [Gammaproteobacteria bacterium RIFCSPHIGHO2_12_FULL_45_9]|nr:MAG: hypothetical protein A3J38_08680 [Gammaproteobacteria bacterium RIFCSPHIGHO2_12_FULL_45_9]
MATEKIQKILARFGVGSRRYLETLIAAGRVTVNGQVAQLGDRASEADQFVVEGKPCRMAPVKQQVLLYHKPLGEVCTRSDPEGRPTIFDHLPVLQSGRWISIGRLDINTSGLLLLTTDGELANRLMHPSQGIEREYLVRIRGVLTPVIEATLLQGVMLEDGMARFLRIIRLETPERGHVWCRVVVAEGRNRVVRRLLESQGVMVNRLKRIRFGSVVLPKTLQPGQAVQFQGGFPAISCSVNRQDG